MIILSKEFFDKWWAEIDVELARQSEALKALASPKANKADFKTHTTYEAMDGRLS